MTTTAPGTRHAPPTRFLADPEWSRVSAARLGSLVGAGAEPTRHDLDAIADDLRSEDEIGRALAAAVHRGETTFAEFRSALAGGAAEKERSAPVAEFFRHVEQRPDWVDDALLREGARVLRQFGSNLVDVLGCALLAGYGTSADTELLTRTGRLTADPLRRMGETMTWVVECVRDGGLERGGQGWQLTVHVRLMHAFINHRFRTGGDWDEDRHGVPINQADQGGTLGLHCTYYLLGARMLGQPFTRRQSEAVMHLWRYVGWLMGVGDRWLPRDEQDGRLKFYHLSLTVPPPDEHSRELAAALERARASLHFSRLQWLRRRWELAKFRSLCRVLVGARTVRELGLRPALPWYVLMRAPVNLVLHGLLARLPGGRALLLRRGERQLDRDLRRHFGRDDAAVARHEDA